MYAFWKLTDFFQFQTLKFVVDTYCLRVRGRVKGGETEREKENVMLNGMRVRESERKSEREQEICVERIIGENETRNER